MNLFVLALSLLWHLSAVIKPPKGYYKSKGRRPYEWRIVFCLCILRMVLVKKYDQYETESRGYDSAWLDDVGFPR